MKPSHNQLEGIRFLESRNTWQARIKRDGKPLSKTFRTHEEAILWRDATREKKTTPEGSAFEERALSPTCEDLIPRWLNTSEEHYGEQSLLRMRTDVKNHIQPHLGSVRLSDLGSRTLLDFFIAIAETPYSSGGRKRSTKTVKNLLSTVSSFFEWCAIGGFIENNPAKDSRFREQFSRRFRTRKPAEALASNIKSKALSPNEAHRLIAVALQHSVEDAFAIEFFIHTAGRLGELSAVTWKDVWTHDRFGNELPAPVINIDKTMSQHTKNVKKGAKWGSNGLVELNSAAVQLLERWKPAAEQVGYSTNDDSFIFPQVARNPKAFSKRVRRLAEKARIRHTTAHSLRHTSITLQVIGGSSLEKVQRVARHKTMSMTSAYYDATQMPTHGVTESIVRVLNGAGVEMSSPVRLIAGGR
jgi:integrase